jgi:hypothetical protein
MSLVIAGDATFKRRYGFIGGIRILDAKGSLVPDTEGAVVAADSTHVLRTINCWTSRAVRKEEHEGSQQMGTSTSDQQQ